MKHIINRNNWIFIMFMVFVLPTIYLIGGSILKFEPGLPRMYNMAEPMFIKMGLNEKLGFNINLLILFGPIVAPGFTLISLVNIKSECQQDFYPVAVYLGRKRKNLL